MTQPENAYGYMPGPGSFFAPEISPAQMSPYASPSGFDQLLQSIRGTGMLPSNQMVGQGGLGNPLMTAIMQQVASYATGTQVSMLPPSYDFYMQVQNQRQQQALSQLRALGQQLDTELYSRLATHTVGAFHPGASPAETAHMGSSLGSNIARFMYNPATEQILSAFPAARPYIERIFGSTAQAMSTGIYYGTRHMGVDSFGMSTEAVGGLVRGLSERMWEGDIYRSEYAHGLNRREMGELTGVLYRHNLLQLPSMVRDKQGNIVNDANGRPQVNNLDAITGQVGQYASLAASLRDVFGHDRSMQEVFSNLQQMTGGGLDNLNVGQLNQMVDRIKLIGQKANISLQAMTLLAGQGAQAARQLGLAGPAGAAMMVESVGQMNTIMNSRQAGAFWGQYTEAEMLQSISQDNMAGMMSVEGVSMQGILRLAANSPGNKGLQQLAGQIRGGSVPGGIAGMAGSPIELARHLSGMGVLGGDVGAIHAALTNRYANAQYAGDAQSAVWGQSGVRQQEYLAGIVADTGSTGDRVKDVQFAREAAAALFDDTGGTEESRKAAFMVVAAKYGVNGEAAYSHTLDKYQGTFGVSLKNTLDKHGGKAQADQAAAKLFYDTQGEIQGVLRDSGFGRTGSFGGAILQAIVSGEETSAWKVIGKAMGMEFADDQAVKSQIGAYLSDEQMGDVEGVITNIMDEGRKLYRARVEAGDDPVKVKAATDAYMKWREKAEASLQSNSLSILTKRRTLDAAQSSAQGLLNITGVDERSAKQAVGYMGRMLGGLLNDKGELDEDKIDQYMAGMGDMTIAQDEAYREALRKAHGVYSSRGKALGKDALDSDRASLISRGKAAFKNVVDLMPGMPDIQQQTEKKDMSVDSITVTGKLVLPSADPRQGSPMSLLPDAEDHRPAWLGGGWNG